MDTASQSIDVQDSKRLKHGEEIAAVNSSSSGEVFQLSVLANDVIKLHFSGYEESISPTYTHQLFDDELITFDPLSYSQDIVDSLCIDVNIDLSGGISLSSVLVTGNIDDAKKTEILGKLGKGLPDVVGEEDARFLPCGRLLRSFKVEDAAYEIWHATHEDKGACECLKQAERLAVWFIETADSVDFRDDRWEVLFLLRATTCVGSDLNKDRVFVGYTTLFSFRNPMIGSKLRICQALILPTVQVKSTNEHGDLHYNLYLGIL